MSKKLYVGNLPQSATQESLERMFGELGEVNSVSLIKDRDSGRSRGFAFVEITRDNDVGKVIDALDGSMMDEHEIRVNEAKPARRSNDLGYRAR